MKAVLSFLIFWILLFLIPAYFIGQMGNDRPAVWGGAEPDICDAYNC